MFWLQKPVCESCDKASRYEFIICPPPPLSWLPPSDHLHFYSQGPVVMVQFSSSIAVLTMGVYLKGQNIPMVILLNKLNNILNSMLMIHAYDREPGRKKSQDCFYSCCRACFPQVAWLCVCVRVCVCVFFNVLFAFFNMIFGTHFKTCLLMYIYAHK